MNGSQKVKSLIERGKLRYVLLYGVVFFGILSATLALLIRIVIGDEVTAVGIGIQYILFSIAGIFWGLFMWKHITRRFQEPTEAEQVNRDPNQAR